MRVDIGIGGDALLKRGEFDAGIGEADGQEDDLTVDRFNGGGQLFAGLEMQRWRDVEASRVQPALVSLVHSGAEVDERDEADGRARRIRFFVFLPLPGHLLGIALLSGPFLSGAFLSGGGLALLQELLFLRRQRLALLHLLADDVRVYSLSGGLRDRHGEEE